MSQLVETGNGLAEFPDEMSHDDIAGVIQKQFYSTDNPPPTEISSTGSSKAENAISRMDQAPSYPSKADAAHGALENLAGAATETAAGIPGFLAKIPEFALQGTKLVQGTLQEKLQALSYLGKEAAPMGVQMAKDIESPLGSKESFRGFIQAGLMAAPGLELARDIRAGSLGAKLAPVTGSEVLPEVPKVGPLIEAPPVQEIPVTPKVETSEVTPQTEPVPEAQQTPAESVSAPKAELPDIEVTLNATTPKGEPLEVKMNAKEAETMLEQRKTALENLRDCLGA